MTVSVETLIDRSVRNMGAVHPVVKQKAIQLIKQAYSEGILLQISSGLRSFEDQARIYGQGRKSFWYNGKDYGNPSKSVVSNAKPGQSVHNYGLAIDYCLVSSDGQRALWTVNDKWKRVAAIGKSLGFSWGGDWENFKDYPHLQLTGGLTWQDLKAGKRPEHLLKEVKGVSEVKNQKPSKWAEESWKQAKELGLFDGTRPQEAITREEAASVVVRLYQKLSN
ncbi:M15 family metallopeptidase [Bacillus tianshenii]|nr:M15 family metallopeptidase [Bacillus tianshenii]